MGPQEAIAGQMDVNIEASQQNEEAKVKAFIDGVPKVENHSHFGGSVIAKFAFEKLKDANGVMYYNGKYAFHSAEELDDFLRSSVTSLNEYLYKYKATRPVFDDVGNIGPLIDSMAGRYHEENTHILMIRTALKGLDIHSGADSFPEYSLDEEIQAYKEAIEKARERYRMIINLILCIRRGSTKQDVEIGERTVDVAAELMQEGLVKGIDLAGKEIDNHAKHHGPTFRRAKHLGLGRTGHAGEAVHQGSVRSLMKYCW